MDIIFRKKFEMVISVHCTPPLTHTHTNFCSYLRKKRNTNYKIGSTFSTNQDIWYHFRSKILDGGGAVKLPKWVNIFTFPYGFSNMKLSYTRIFGHKNPYMYRLIFRCKSWWYTYLRIFTDFSQKSVYVPINFWMQKLVHVPTDFYAFLWRIRTTCIDYMRMGMTVNARTYRFLCIFVKNPYNMYWLHAYGNDCGCSLVCTHM